MAWGLRDKTLNPAGGWAGGSGEVRMPAALWAGVWGLRRPCGDGADVPAVEEARGTLSRHKGEGDWGAGEPGAGV